MRNHGTVWIVLVNESCACILRRRAGGTSRYEELVRERSIEAPLPARDLVSDRIGGGFEGVASLRHAAAKLRFEHPVADIVNQAALQGLFDGLVLVAPPHLLGTLRRALAPAAVERLIREEAKDYLALPEQALPARLNALMRR